MTNDAKNINRGSDAKRLVDLIKGTNNSGPSIIGISGPGGVGKTFLLNHVIESAQLEKDWLILRADGSNADTRNDFFGLLNGQLFKRSLPSPADGRKDYFPRIREVARLHKELVEKALRELEKQGAPEQAKNFAKLLLLAGKVLNPKKGRTATVAGVANRLTGKDVEAGLNAAWDLISNLRGLRESTYLPGPLRDLLGTTRRNRVKSDLYSLTAEELRVDLTAALAGYEKKDAKKFTHQRIPGLTKVLFVLDDYEATHTLIEDFLVGSFIQELADVPFQSVLVVLCRRLPKHAPRLGPAL